MTRYADPQMADPQITGRFVPHWSPPLEWLGGRGGPPGAACDRADIRTRVMALPVCPSHHEAQTVHEKGILMQKPNNLLQRDVREELDWDPILNETRIVVKVDGGRVILSGAVDTFADVEQAGVDAWSVGGVKAVDNELLVGLT